jgi:hypothetical protein
MSFYTIQYKIVVDLELSERLEIKRSEKFIEKIMNRRLEKLWFTYIMLNIFNLKRGLSYGKEYRKR